MTDEAPKEIQAWTWNGRTNCVQWHVNGQGETTKYLRADHALALVAEAYGVAAKRVHIPDDVSATDDTKAVCHWSRKAILALIEKDKTNEHL